MLVLHGRDWKKGRVHHKAVQEGGPVYEFESAPEGSIFNAGTVVQWMRDELSFYNEAKDVEDLASQSKNILTFVPAFTGLGAPYWRSDIRGSIHGITRDTSKSDIALAALKSICFQSNISPDRSGSYDRTKPSIVKIHMTPSPQNHVL